MRSGGTVKERVLKMSSLIDQHDESELLPPVAAEVDRWFQNYIMVMGSQPDETEEPTPAPACSSLQKSLYREQVSIHRFLSLDAF